MKKLARTYQAAAPTLALVFAVMALCLGGAVASGKLVIRSSAQIKNGVITSQDVRNGTVKSTDIHTNAVTSPDIAPNGVQASDAEFPEAKETVEPPGDVAKAEVGEQFGVVDVVEPPYVKESAETSLEVSWVGTAGAGFQGCIFQLRVDKQPASPDAGEIYVPNGGGAESVMDTAVFDGLAAGPHTVEIWAKLAQFSGATYPCRVGPVEANVAQSFTMHELVQ